MKKLMILLMLLCFLILPFRADAGVPLDTVKANVNKVLDVLRDPALQGESNKEAKEKKIGAVADEMFDYVALSKLTLSRNWKKLSSAQQTEFVKLYRGILEQAYMDKILDYTDEKVVFEKETMLSENKAEVQTKIITSSKEIPINYRVLERKGQWRIYDVVIEGISLVKNYRTQFNEILTNKSPEQMLDDLRKKGDKA